MQLFPARISPSARRLSLLVFVLGLPISGAAAGEDPSHVALRELVASAGKAGSDPGVCQSYLDAAASQATALANRSCSTGYSVRKIHGTLIAIRLLLRLGNTLLHQHGCASAAESILGQARQILISTPPSCLSGNEAMAAAVAFDLKELAAAEILEGIPAGSPNLWPYVESSDPGGGVDGTDTSGGGGTPPPPPDRCQTEDPDLNSVYNAARSWCQSNCALDSPRDVVTTGGAVECYPSDPPQQWRVTVAVSAYDKTSNFSVNGAIETTTLSGNYTRTVNVNVSDMSCRQ